MTEVNYCDWCNGYGSSLKDPENVLVCTKCGGSGVKGVKKADLASTTLTASKCNNVSTLKESKGCVCVLPAGHAGQHQCGNFTEHVWPNSDTSSVFTAPEAPMAGSNIFVGIIIGDREVIASCASTAREKVMRLIAEVCRDEWDNFAVEYKRGGEIVDPSDIDDLSVINRFMDATNNYYSIERVTLQ